jgi:hypothetical protein
MIFVILNWISFLIYSNLFEVRALLLFKLETKMEERKSKDKSYKSCLESSEFNILTTLQPLTNISKERRD